MTPEEARQILESFANEKQEDVEAVYVWWLVQREVMKGDRADELAKLHTEIWIRRRTGQVSDDPQEKRDAIMEQLHQAALAKLTEEGLPPEWKTEK